MIGALVVIFIIGFFSCAFDNSSGSVGNTDEAVRGEINDLFKEAESEGKEGIVEPALWKETELTDVLTGETYKSSDFRGQTIIDESIAVWCPKLTSHQEKIK